MATTSNPIKRAGVLNTKKESSITTKTLNRNSISSHTVIADHSTVIGINSKVCFAHNFDKKSAPSNIKCSLCSTKTRSSTSSNLHLIQCCDCHQFIDIACARITNLEFSQYFNEAAVVWFCRSCQLNDLKEHRKEQIDIIRTQFTEFVSPIQANVNSLELKTKALESIVPINTSKIFAIEENISRLSAQIEIIKTAPQNNPVIINKEVDKKLELFEKLTRANNLILRDVPVLKNDDISNYVLGTAKFLNLKLTANDFNCHRFKQQASASPAAILVKFHNVNIKHDFYGRYLDAIKNNRHPTLERIQHSKTASRIYVNHHLTHNDMALFIQARKLVRNKTISQAFTSFGNVYIRVKGINDRKLKITSMDQLEGDFVTYN